METVDAPAQTGRARVGRFRTHRRPAWERAGSVREEEFSQALLRMAQMSAARQGLPLEEAQDCGIGFVVHMLTEETLVARVCAGEPISSAWLHACADHWTANFVRYRRRLYAHECLTAEMPEAAQPPCAAPIRSREAEGPEAQMLRLELMQRLLAATLPLTDSQRDLFTRRYLEEHSIEEIAAQTGRTPGAVKQGLASLRRRLQALLNMAGLTHEEIAQYLHLLACPAMPPARRTPREREE